MGKFTELQVDLIHLFEEQAIGARPYAYTIDEDISANDFETYSLKPSSDELWKLSAIHFGDTCLYNFYVTIYAEGKAIVPRQRIITPSMNNLLSAEVLVSSEIWIKLENDTDNDLNPEVLIHYTIYSKKSFEALMARLNK